MRSIQVLLFLCIFNGAGQTQAFTLIPESVKRSCSSWLNLVGALCYYKSKEYTQDKTFGPSCDQSQPSQIIQGAKIPSMNIRSSILEKCGDVAYILQGPLATKEVKNPYVLRNFLLDALNVSGATFHYSAGIKAAYDDSLSQSMASFLHRLGNTSYTWHTNLARYEGMLKNILDGTDLSKKSHLFATLLVTALAMHISYKLYKNFVYRPLAYTGDILFYQPSKKICEKTYDKLKATLHELTSKNKPNQALDT